MLAQAQPGATVGRPHIADALVAAGDVRDRDEAFVDAASRPQPLLRAPLRPGRRAGGPAGARGRGRAGHGPPVREPAWPHRQRRGRSRRWPRPGSAGLEVYHRDHVGPERGTRPARWPSGWDCSSPAPATTTGPARRTASARTPPTPELCSAADRGAGEQRRDRGARREQACSDVERLRLGLRHAARDHGPARARCRSSSRSPAVAHPEAAGRRRPPGVAGGASASSRSSRCSASRSSTTCTSRCRRCRAPVACCCCSSPSSC